MTRPTRLKDMPKEERDIIIGAWWRTEDIEAWNPEKGWAPRPYSKDNNVLEFNGIYRIKPDLLTEATALLSRWSDAHSHDDALWTDTKAFIDKITAP